MNSETMTAPAPAMKSTPVANGAAKPKAATKPKPEAKPNVVTLADLCKEAKVEPKVARVRLRASKLKKSSSGWQWQKGSATLKEVRKVITAAE